MPVKIMVIDNLFQCVGCPFWILTRFDGKTRDFCTKERKIIDNPYKLQDWCTLKDLPEKMEEGYPADDYTIGKADGWNACLKAITGEYRKIK